MDLISDPDVTSFTVTVMVQRRFDGGLRAWSDDVPGLVLSHSDPTKVLADIEPVLEVILSEKAGQPMKARRRQPLVTPAPSKTPKRLEYLASTLAA